MDLAEITTAKPAIFRKGLTGCLLVFVVMAKDHRPAKLQFSCFAIRKRCATLVDDAYLQACDRISEARELPTLVAVGKVARID